MSTFADNVMKLAAQNMKTIVLPEGNDERMIEAAAFVVKNGFAKIVILGDVDTITKGLKSHGVDPSSLVIKNPKTDEKLAQYAEGFFELRKSKGVTMEQAQEIVKDELYFGTMMVQLGDADGMVAGACHSSGDTIRPALQIIKSRPGMKTVSSMFFMCMPDATYLYSDCGLVEDPTEDQLVDIAMATAKTGLQFGIQPRVAMLSYSTKGSARGVNAVKVANAAKKAIAAAKEEFGDSVLLDGELQFDAAFVPSVAASKAPGSPIEGKANTFIFPDLGAGNICYKMTQRLAGAEAYGPILQGLNKPVNDLSRGCTAEDIYVTVAITALQAL